MKQTIARVALVVPDYDEAIAFYCARLGFDLLEDASNSSKCLGTRHTELSQLFTDPFGDRWDLLQPA